MRDLATLHDIDINQIIECNEKIINLNSYNIFPNAKDHLLNIERLSNKSENIVNMKIGQNYYRVDRSTDVIWESSNPIDNKDKERIYEFYRTYYKNNVFFHDNTFSYFPVISESNGCRLVNNKLLMFNPRKIMFRLNYKIFQEKIYGTGDDLFLLKPIFNKNIDNALLKILNKYTFSNIDIYYSNTNIIDNIFKDFI